MSEKRKKSTLRTQLITTAVALGVTVALAIVYFIAVRGLGSGEESKKEPTILSGEYYAYNSLYLFEPFSSDDMQRISVVNENGGYTVERGDDGEFYVNENKNAAYSPTLFASLAVAVGRPMASTRIEPAEGVGSEPDYINYANYGLDEDSESGSFTVVRTDGTEHTVHIGYAVSSGDGYYARLDGRNAVYIISNDVKSTVLAPVENIITPMLGFPVSTNEYRNFDNFTVWHGGEHFVTVHKLADNEEVSDLAASSNYVLAFSCGITPEQAVACDSEKKQSALFGTDALNYSYVPDIDGYGSMLSGFASFQGDATVAIKEGDNTSISSDQLKKFGIDPTNPAHELFYTYNGVNSYIIFSEKTDDGYYAYSYLFDIIAHVPADKVECLEWNLTQWVEPAFFQRNISKVASIAVESEDTDIVFDLQTVPQSDGKSDLIVRANGKLLDTKNFREFYKVILTREIRGQTDERPSDGAKADLTVTVTTDAGTKIEYGFYRMSTQRAFLTINGVGGFYLVSSSVDELVSDAKKAALDIPVDAYDRK